MSNIISIDSRISINGISGLTKDQALAFLAQKRIFIEGRGIPEEYEALASEYESIGAEHNAHALRQKAEALRNV